MRRSALGIVMIVLLLVVAGCGGASSTNQNANQETIPPRLQNQLGRDAQRQLRAQLHDRTLKVRGVQCEEPAGGTSACVMQVVSHTGQHGTISISVTLDSKNRTAQASFVGTSNRRWAATLRGRSGKRRSRRSAAR